MLDLRLPNDQKTPRNETWRRQHAPILWHWHFTDQCNKHCQTLQFFIVYVRNSFKRSMNFVPVVPFPRNPDLHVFTNPQRLKHSRLKKTGHLNSWCYCNQVNMIFWCYSECTLYWAGWKISWPQRDSSLFEITPSNIIENLRQVVFTTENVPCV